MNYFKPILLILFLIFSFQNNVKATSNLDIEELINEAIKNNPEIKLIQENIKSTETKVNQVSSLDDPMLGIGTMNFPLNIPAFGDEMMTTYQVSLSQKVPYPKKLTLKSDITKYSVLSIYEKLYEKKNDLKKRIKLAYYELFFIDRSIEIIEKNKTMMRSFIKITESKYSVGKGLLQDILKSYVELSKLTEKAINLKQIRKNTVYEINSLLYRPLDTSLENISELSVFPINISNEGLLEIAKTKSPTLKKIKLINEKNKVSKDLNKLGYIPDFNFSIAYSMRKNRADLVSGNVSVNFPLWYKTKQKNKILESEYRIMEFNEKYNESLNNISFQIYSLKSNLDKEAELHNLFIKGIIPQSKQALKSTISGYQVGNMDFLTLLNNQITLWNYEIQAYKKLTEYNKHLAKLEFVIGGDLRKVLINE